MNKAVGLILALTLGLFGLVGCDTTTTSTDQGDTTDTTTTSGPISVTSREDGSGTRGAFVELFEIVEEDASGEEVDNTTEDAVITNSTSVMMTTVSGDESAIGYISLGSLNDTVKAVKIDGADATVENVKDGTYKISRPFNIATKGAVDATTQDFIDFILSSDGQSVVEENGYIAYVDNAAAYTGEGASGKIVVAGSSSVTPVMEKLKEAYIALNPDVSIEVQQSDSSTGMSSTIDGICQIGMASRELKDSEKEAGLSSTVIAIDGIAVIVNNDSTVENLTSDQVKGIFTGEITNWDEIAE